MSNETMKKLAIGVWAVNGGIGFLMYWTILPMFFLFMATAEIYAQAIDKIIDEVAIEAAATIEIDHDIGNRRDHSVLGLSIGTLFREDGKSEINWLDERDEQSDDIEFIRQNCRMTIEGKVAETDRIDGQVFILVNEATSVRLYLYTHALDGRSFFPIQKIEDHQVSNKYLPGIYATQWDLVKTSFLCYNSETQRFILASGESCQPAKVTRLGERSDYYVVWSDGIMTDIILINRGVVCPLLLHEKVGNIDFYVCSDPDKAKKVGDKVIHDGEIRVIAIEDQCSGIESSRDMIYDNGAWYLQSAQLTHINDQIELVSIWTVDEDGQNGTIAERFVFTGRGDGFLRTERQELPTMRCLSKWAYLATDDSAVVGIYTHALGHLQSHFHTVVDEQVVEGYDGITCDNKRVTIKLESGKIVTFDRKTMKWSKSKLPPSTN